MPDDNGTGTVSTKEPTLTVGYVMLVIALFAQGAQVVELFTPGSAYAKIVVILGMVLTGLGFNAARKVQP